MGVISQCPLGVELSHLQSCLHTYRDLRCGLGAAWSCLEPTPHPFSWDLCHLLSLAPRLVLLSLLMCSGLLLCKEPQAVVASPTRFHALLHLPLRPSTSAGKVTDGRVGRTRGCLAPLPHWTPYRGPSSFVNLLGSCDLVALSISSLLPPPAVPRLPFTS